MLTVHDSETAQWDRLQPERLECAPHPVGSKVQPTPLAHPSRRTSKDSGRQPNEALSLIAFPTHHGWRSSRRPTGGASSHQFLDGGPRRRRLLLALPGDRVA